MSSRFGNVDRSVGGKLLRLKDRKRQNRTLCPVLPVLGYLVLAGASALAVEPGTLPRTWITGGPNCLEVPDWQIHAYNPTFYILRESGCTHYEKPFLYLILGRARALLVDTGAGASDAAVIVRKILRQKPLIVMHSHQHSDHTAGDKGFAGFIEKRTGELDLGDRIVDVIAIPGHE